MDARERLARISAATGGMQIFNQGLRYCFILGAQALHPYDWEFIEGSDTSSLNPIS